MKLLEDNFIDSIITDPPYNLVGNSRKGSSQPGDLSTPYGRSGPSKKRGFMGKEWDGTGIAFNIDIWKECLRVLKPGGYLLAFGGTRTYHRMVCAIEDAGFEIKDQIQWIYGSGFPKSTDASKQIDKKAGIKRNIIGYSSNPNGNFEGYIGKRYSEKRQTKFGIVQDQPLKTAPASELAEIWDGWGTALKPAHEPIVMARKSVDKITSGELRELTGWDYWCNSKSAGKDYPKGYELWTYKALHKNVQSFCAIKDENGNIIKEFNFENYSPFSTDILCANLFKWQVGAINIDDCRIKYNPENEHFGKPNNKYNKNEGFEFYRGAKQQIRSLSPQWGRFPANIILDEEAGKILDKQTGVLTSGSNCTRTKEGNFLEHGGLGKAGDLQITYGDSGGASRFFYCAKASKKERGEGNNHPTVKPLALIKYLITLVTPPKGISLDLFAGSGTHAIACKELGFNFIGFEISNEYCEIAEKRQL